MVEGTPTPQISPGAGARSPRTFRERIGEILIKSKRVTADQLEAAIKVSKAKGAKLSKILADQGLVTERDLLVLISAELDLPTMSLARFTVDPELVRLLPKEMVRQVQILPVARLGKQLTVAMADPLDVLAMDDVRSMTGLEVRPVLAHSEEILETLRRFEQTEAPSLETVAQGLSEGAGLLSEKVAEEGPVEVAELVRLTKETPVVKITDAILAEAVTHRASDILVEPMEKRLRIRYRVDGILQERPAPPKAMHPALLSRIKILSGLDIAETRRPQDGRFKAKIGGREIDFRVATVPSSFGEKAAIRILDKQSISLDLDKLSFEPESLAALKTAAGRPYGMILVCGPAGAGKTTTLYSVLKHVDKPDINIVTVEDPVEFQLPGINQVSIRPDIGLTFAAALRSILRQDPDVIMIGEVRDLETVDIAIKAALTGHLVLATLHTTTVSSSIVRLINMGVEPFLITSSVICVAAQRLLRRLCPRCKVGYPVTDALREKYDLSRLKPDAKFFRAGGCEACGRSGYLGRLGIIEVGLLNQETRDLINARAREPEFFAALRRAGMRTLQENGAAKAAEGLTSWEEVLRVTIGLQD